jgi:hypothetical protein
LTENEQRRRYSQALVIGFAVDAFYMLKFKFGLLMVEKPAGLKKAGGSDSPEGLERLR